MDVKPVQKRNILWPIIEFSINTDDKRKQPLKTRPPTFVTELGIVIDVKPVHPENIS